jgi:glycosyltransferase involved in cell wall biosynthesis
MVNPRLSICIATYNRGKFIGDTLDSILGQMTPEIELVDGFISAQ